MKKERVLLKNYKLSSDLLTAMFVRDLSLRISKVNYLKKGVSVKIKDYKKVLNKIRANREKGADSVSVYFDDPGRTIITFFYNNNRRGRPIEFADITEFERRYGKGVAQRMFTSLDTHYINCSSKMTYDAIVSALATYAEKKPIDTSFIKQTVEITLEDYRKANIPVSPSNFVIDFLLDDEKCTCLSLIPNMYCFEKDCSTPIEKIDVSEFDENYGEGKAKEIIAQLDIEEKTIINPDGEGK